MIKQKNSQKVTAQGKRRVNLYKLQQRLEALEKQVKLQSRINAHQVQHNETVTLSTEVILERVRRLERIVLPAQPPFKKRNIIARALAHYRAWLIK
ncbi:hypothetical protein [Necropsobacter rosorum]|uniref:hypothetical protein n=1 Tax=Necropsobacter rosorum TaxID=908285 RepID=UPI000509EA26